MLDIDGLTRPLPSAGRRINCWSNPQASGLGTKRPWVQSRHPDLSSPRVLCISDLRASLVLGLSHRASRDSTHSNRLNEIKHHPSPVKYSDPWSVDARMRSARDEGLMALGK